MTEITSVSPITRLPEEIFSNILKRVRNDTPSSSFLSCLLCCKRWRDTARSILCQDIVLRNPNIRPFLERFPLSCYQFVRSLTIRITPENAMEPTKLGLSDEELRNTLIPASKILWERVTEIAGQKLGEMDHLATFSLVLEEENVGLRFWIPRPTIATIVDNLPASCVNLEIDSKGIDHCGPGSAHLCESLRAILPRLQHLRLRIRFICPAIFGEGFTAEGTVDNEKSFKPVSAPKLKTVMINCVALRSNYARVCGTLQYHEKPVTIHEKGYPEARISLAKCLRLLFERSSFPAVERLWMLDWQRPSDENGTQYASYNRRDIAKNKTWAIPYRRVWPTEKDSLFTRTPEGIEGLSAHWAIQALSEDEMWKETTNGSRFPAELHSVEDWHAQGYSRKELPLESVDEYRGRYPKRGFGLWVNERKAETTLLGPVEREGLMDISPVVEFTPPGWTRTASPTQRLKNFD